MTLFVSIIVVITTIYIFYRELKKLENKMLKALYIVILFIIEAPIIMFNIDYYNIPSRLNLTETINASAWLSFLGTYLASISGALIAAFTLISITIHQMKKTFEFQNSNNKENKRIEIMPFFDYEMNTDSKTRFDSASWYYIGDFDRNKKREVQLNIKIQNIGLGHVRKVCYKFNGAGFENECYEGKIKSLLKKDEETWVSYIFNFEQVSNENLTLSNINDQIYQQSYDYIFNIYYQDMLFNNYKQTIDFNINIGYALKANNDIIERNSVQINHINEETIIDKFPVE